MTTGNLTEHFSDFIQGDDRCILRYYPSSRHFTYYDNLKRNIYVVYDDCRYYFINFFF